MYPLAGMISIKKGLKTCYYFYFQQNNSKIKDGLSGAKNQEEVCMKYGEDKGCRRTRPPPGS